MIRITKLKKYYGDIKAVDKISLEIKQGEVLGFLGPNGAGKTTTMKILTGFMAPTSGEIKVDDLDILDDSLAIRARMGYLPENNPLYEDMKVYEYLQFVGRLRGLYKTKLRERIKKMVKVCGLEKVLRQTIGELSKGYRQRVGLAQAMLHDPDILVLDEPTSGLDPNQIVEIRQLIKEVGKAKTVILCTHILQEVQATCDRVVIMNNGRLVAEGTPQELTSQAAGKDQMYVKIKGPVDEVTAALHKLANIESISMADKEADDIIGYQLVIAGQHDIREALFQLASTHQWSILESHKESISLEDVFRKLTKN
ncbi:MAG: ATP-binding cassette domain-containing protein [Candidatus Komeilibacteria bacterium]